MIDNFTIEENIIAQHKIASNDTILHLGAGYKDGIIIDSLCNFWDISPKELTTFTGVDVDTFRIEKLSKTFTSSEFWNISMQEYLDNYTNGETSNYDWCILTGVFNDYLYGDMQHNFLLKTVSKCLDISNNGVIFSFNEKLSEDFKYSLIFIFSNFITTYSKVFVQKTEDDNYIFSILK
jgi:hypothetical protein